MAIDPNLNPDPNRSSREATEGVTSGQSGNSGVDSSGIGSSGGVQINPQIQPQITAEERAAAATAAANTPEGRRKREELRARKANKRSSRDSGMAIRDTAAPAVMLTAGLENLAAEAAQSADSTATSSASAGGGSSSRNGMASPVYDRGNRRAEPNVNELGDSGEADGGEGGGNGRRRRRNQSNPPVFVDQVFPVSPPPPTGGTGGAAPTTPPTGGTGGAAPTTPPTGGTGGAAPTTPPTGGTGGAAPTTPPTVPFTTPAIFDDVITGDDAVLELIRDNILNRDRAILNDSENAFIGDYLAENYGLRHYLNYEPFLGRYYDPTNEVDVNAVSQQDYERAREIQDAFLRRLENDADARERFDNFNRRRSELLRQIQELDPTWGEDGEGRRRRLSRADRLLLNDLIRQYEALEPYEGARENERIIRLYENPDPFLRPLDVTDHVAGMARSADGETFLEPADLYVDYTTRADWEAAAERAFEAAREDPQRWLDDYTAFQVEMVQREAERVREEAIRARQDEQANAGVNALRSLTRKQRRDFERSAEADSPHVVAAKRRMKHDLKHRLHIKELEPPEEYKKAQAKHNAKYSDAKRRDLRTRREIRRFDRDRKASERRLEAMLDETYKEKQKQYREIMATFNRLWGERESSKWGKRLTSKYIQMRLGYSVNLRDGTYTDSHGNEVSITVDTLKSILTEFEQKLANRQNPFAYTPKDRKALGTYCYPCIFFSRRERERLMRNSSLRSYFITPENVNETNEDVADTFNEYLRNQWNEEVYPAIIHDLGDGTPEHDAQLKTLLAFADVVFSQAGIDNEYYIRHTGCPFVLTQDHAAMMLSMKTVNQFCQDRYNGPVAVQEANARVEENLQRSMRSVNRTAKKRRTRRGYDGTYQGTRNMASGNPNLTLTIDSLATTINALQVVGSVPLAVSSFLEKCIGELSMSMFSVGRRGYCTQEMMDAVLSPQGLEALQSIMMLKSLEGYISVRDYVAQGKRLTIDGVRDYISETYKSLSEKEKSGKTGNKIVLALRKLDDFTRKLERNTFAMESLFSKHDAMMWVQEFGYQVMRTRLVNQGRSPSEFTGNVNFQLRDLSRFAVADPVRFIADAFSTEEGVAAHTITQTLTSGSYTPWSMALQRQFLLHPGFKISMSLVDRFLGYQMNVVANLNPIAMTTNYLMSAGYYSGKYAVRRGIGNTVRRAMRRDERDIDVDITGTEYAFGLNRALKLDANGRLDFDANMFCRGLLDCLKMDLCRLGSKAVMILIGISVFFAFDIEPPDDPEKRLVVGELKIGGVPLYLNYWLQDVLSYVGPIGLWVAAREAGYSQDECYKLAEQLVWDGFIDSFAVIDAMTFVSESLAYVAGDEEMSTSGGTSYADVQEKYGDQVDELEYYSTSAICFALRMFANALTPKVVRDWMNDDSIYAANTLARSKTQIYTPDPTDDPDATTSTTWADSMYRRLGASNFFTGMLLNIRFGIYGSSTDDKTGYTRDEMPLLESPDEYNSYWREYFDIEGMDIETAQARVGEALEIYNHAIQYCEDNDIPTTEVGEVLAEQGFLLPNSFRAYWYEYYVADQAQELEASFLAREASGEWSSTNYPDLTYDERYALKKEAKAQVQAEIDALYEIGDFIWDEAIPSTVQTEYRRSTNYKTRYYYADADGNYVENANKRDWFVAMVTGQGHVAAEMYAYGDNSGPFGAVIWSDDNYNLYDDQSPTPWTGDRTDISFTEYLYGGRTLAEATVANTMAASELYTPLDIGSAAFDIPEFTERLTPATTQTGLPLTTSTGETVIQTEANDVESAFSTMYAGGESDTPLFGERAYVPTSREYEDLSETKAAIDERVDAAYDSLFDQLYKSSGSSSGSKTYSSSGYSGGYSYSSGGGSSRSYTKIYSNPASSISADKATTMYAKTPYSTTYDYLKPDFETKGSREAYKRSDI